MIKKIAETITDVNTFLGVLLSWSSMQYNNNLKP